MIISVQYMRAIAALLVVIHHAAWKGGQYSTNPMYWFKVGGAGVDLFFIISGYIMCHTTFHKKINFIGFMKARVIRIIPLYWILTTVALCIYLLKPDKINSSGGNTSIINSFTLFPTTSKYLIQNGWTLSYEFYFYIIFSLGLFFSGILKNVVPVIVLLLLLLVMTGKLFKINNIYFMFFTNPLLLEFVMGIAAFNIHRMNIFKKRFSFALILVSIILLVNVNFFGGFSERVFDYGIPCFLFFIAMLNLERYFNVFNHKSILGVMVNKIGDSSYSLYLAHPFVLPPCALILSKLGLAEYGYCFVMILITICILLGFVCYAFLEKPIGRLVKRFIADRTILGQPSKSML